MTLRERWQQVEERITRAAERCGRRRSDITLIAVTKKFPAGVIREAYDLGMREFGENYVQEFADKHPQLSGLAGVTYHLIGHLQSNKAKIAAEIFHCVQTVDSAKLAKRLDQLCARPLEVMIEVKLSEEESKAGAVPEEVPGIIDDIRAAPNLRLRGLMTMPPWSEDPENPRPYFRQLAAMARDHSLDCLSMGMSNDLETAIEEGATHVRVGTALFGPRTKP